MNQLQKNQMNFINLRLGTFIHFNVSAKYSCGFPDPQVLPIIVESKDI